MATSADLAFSAEGRQSTKDRRVKELSDAVSDKVPDSYRTNSSKEALCLEFVRNFRDKFQTLFPDRELFLIVPNEYGIPKFVSTTLRPTLLPFRQVYDVQKLASFVANYLDYEPLDRPLAPPSVLPSPTQVLEWGVGDAFDFSVLLASYLLGAGYDAFVVYGYAPQWVTLRNQAHTRCPVLEEEEAAAAAAAAAAAGGAEAKDGAPDELIAATSGSGAAGGGIAAAKASGGGGGVDDDDDDGVSQYHPRPRGVPQSKYLEQLEREQRARDAKAADEWESEDEDEDARKAAEVDDPIAGRRAHAWVLVRGGKRDTHDMFFVESTTGRVFPVADAPYTGIEVGGSERRGRPPSSGVVVRVARRASAWDSSLHSQFWRIPRFTSRGGLGSFPPCTRECTRARHARRHRLPCIHVCFSGSRVCWERPLRGWLSSF